MAQATNSIRSAAPLEPVLSEEQLSHFLARAEAADVQRVRLPAYWVDAAQRHLGSTSRLKVAAVIAAPHGLLRPTHKAIEAAGAVKQGVAEVLIFAASPEVEAVERGGDNHDFIASQREIVRAVRAANPHVTIGVGWPQDCDLAPANLERWAQLIVRSGADYLALPTAMPNAVLTVIDMPIETEAQEVRVSRRHLVEK